MSAYTKQKDGYYHIPIVDFGNRLQDNFGLRVVEHEAFGGVAPGVHSDTSHHYVGNAIDIQDWRGGDGAGAEGFNGVGYVQRTKNLRNLLRGAGAEVIGPGDMEGHETHLHLAGHNKIIKLNDQQYNYLYGGNSGGKMSTFSLADTPTGASTVTRMEAPATDSEGNKRPQAKERAKSYANMTKSQLNAEYDKLRSSGDMYKAQDEGMKMHKAYFNKN